MKTTEDHSVKKCVHFKTVDVHYFELFDNVKISSFIDRPIQISYESENKQTDKQYDISDIKLKQTKLRKLFNHMTTPDKPIKYCRTDPFWKDEVTSSKSGCNFCYYSVAKSGSGSNPWGEAVDVTIGKTNLFYTIIQ